VGLLSVPPRVSQRFVTAIGLATQRPRVVNPSYRFCRRLRFQMLDEVPWYCPPPHVFRRTLSSLTGAPMDVTYARYENQVVGLPSLYERIDHLHRR